MLYALIAGFFTIALIVVIVLVVVMRRRRQSSDVVAPTHAWKSVDTFGVAPKKEKTGFGVAEHTRLAGQKSASGTAGEALRGRFVAMGIFAGGIFGTLAAKLWSMQVLQSESYSEQAARNLYATVYTPAPRGIIYDANGIPLVTNRSSYTVLANADVASNRNTVARLSTLLGIPFQVVRQRILDTSAGVQSSRVVARDASLRNIAFISEHADAFPGVTCEARTQRAYPYGALAAHVLGYTGTASADDFAQVAAGRSIQSGDIVGKSGVEYSYDEMLSGDHGTRTLLTDATGSVRETISSTDPVRGNDVYLTIRGPVQQAADQALREIIAPNGRAGGKTGTAGAVVCLDATNGEIIALSNFPTFEPSQFIGGISSDLWDSLNTQESHYPLMDRVVQGTYPAASTFKAFTAMAALTDSVANATSSWTCTGTWTGFGEAYPQKCWLTTGHGTLDLVGGIAHSCDTVFYEIAKDFYVRGASIGETAMQDYIKEYGFGSKLGIDLAGEAAGRVPTPEWKAEYFKDAPEQAQWQGGDMTNMAIGQGYVLVTPLQIAAGYCGIATGQVWRPHVLREVRNSLGETVLSYTPEVIFTPDQSEANIALVRRGLREVMTINGYEQSYFSDVNYKVAGKTGTAQVAGKQDYSWFACYAPADNPKYVCACLVEEGVKATTSTMPIVARVIKAAMALDAGSIAADSIASVDSSYSASASSSRSTTNSARED